MKAEIARSAPARRCSLREVDIDVAPELVERYGRSVPVLEIAGRAAFKGRLTVAELDEKIARALRERELA
jgi:hypothetical protein